MRSGSERTEGEVLMTQAYAWGGVGVMGVDLRVLGVGEVRMDMRVVGLGLGFLS